jgi:hypothetical protein
LPKNSDAVPNEWYYASVDLANDVTTIAAVPCLLAGWNVNTGISAHPCPIEDNSVVVVSIPASTAAGSYRDMFRPIRTTTNLVVNPDNSATGIVTIIYRILGQP